MDVIDAIRVDGAATMFGKKTAADTLSKLFNPEMLYAYCYGHAMNLAVKDVYFKATITKEPFVII